jgi:hypothetical protein
MKKIVICLLIFLTDCVKYYIPAAANKGIGEGGTVAINV